MNLPERKESPIMGTTGMGGGAGSALVSRFVTPPGQVQFDDHPGGANQTWTVPPGVESISIVAIGGGAGADGQNSGGGGGLTWINNVPVVPGTNLTVYNGKTGSRFGSGNPSGSDTSGQTSEVFDKDGNTIIKAEGGKKNQSNSGGWGGQSGQVGALYQGLTYGGNRGGHGASGSSGKGGGGGAGGYSGSGGNGGGQCSNGGAGSGGGGGGGGGHCTTDGGQGGGTGLQGEGANGSGGGASQYGGPGGGGSGGTAGNSSYGTWTETSANFGGGCGAGSGGAGRGAVRIIWPGDERYFPNTNTADV